ncbi:MAG: hypothetical protein AAF830_02885 [Pseudomonadota bacterium]
MMKSTCLGLLTGAMMFGAQASAATFIANFENGLDGFGTKGFAISQNDAASVAGDRSGGYLEVYDNKWGNGLLTLSGDLIGSLTPGGSISFDAISLGDVFGHHNGFGKITLRGGGLKATYDGINIVPPLNEWASFSISLDAATWGLSEERFATLLGGLTMFEMVLETKNGLGERVGFDNFTFTSGSSVPVPGAALLIAPALAMVAMRGKQKATAATRSGL